jgi:hypothetical protein
MYDEMRLLYEILNLETKFNYLKCKIIDLL